MVALAILRVEKLKSFSNIGGSEKHTARLQETPNADPKKKNVRLIGKADERSLEQVVKEKINNQTNCKPRKDAVLCTEIFLSASPEYFRPHDPSLAGEWDEQKMWSFANASRAWLLSNYGCKCVRAELHLDEATPHIHAYIVPINDKTKRLSYKEMFGGSRGEGRMKLSVLQDSYANAVAPLGIERGIKGSKATHTKVQQYYQAVNSEPLFLELERLAPQPTETAQQLFERIKADAAIVDINHQLADRKFLLLQSHQALQKAITTDKLRQQLEGRVQQLEAQNFQWQNQTLQLRDLPLEDVAWELGLDSDRGKWKGHGHIINIDGSKFYDFSPEHSKGGGGAIDLVMHVNQCNLRQAVVWLHERFGEAGAERAAIAKTRQVTAEIIQLEPRPQFTLPVEDKTFWQAVSNYLTQKRLIPSNLVQALHNQGLVYASEQQNAVFVMRNLDGQAKGAFLRGTRGENNTFKGYEKGTQRAQGWFWFRNGGKPNGEIERVVLCKSAIDAISLAASEGMPACRTMYLAADSHKSLPVEFLKSVSKVEVAYDNNKTGNEIARAIKQLLPNSRRVSPSCGDWNSQLQERSHKQKRSKQQGLEL